jgi:hypothetical protein
MLHQPAEGGGFELLRVLSSMDSPGGSDWRVYVIWRRKEPGRAAQFRTGVPAREFGVAQRQHESASSSRSFWSLDRFDAADPFRAQAERAFLEAAIEQQLALGEGDDAGVELGSSAPSLWVSSASFRP